MYNYRPIVHVHVNYLRHKYGALVHIFNISFHTYYGYLPWKINIPEVDISASYY